MYLPSEGLYGEVYRIPGLVETLRRQYAVMLVGPSVLPGLLHCIRVGHLTLALEQKAGAIGEILSAVKTEWTNLNKTLDTLANRARTLSNGIRDAQKHNRGVGRALATVEALDSARARQVLGLSEQALVIDAELEDDEDAVPLLAIPQPDAERRAGGRVVPRLRPETAWSYRHPSPRECGKGCVSSRPTSPRRRKPAAAPLEHRGGFLLDPRALEEVGVLRAPQAAPRWRRRSRGNCPR